MNWLPRTWLRPIHNLVNPQQDPNAFRVLPDQKERWPDSGRHILAQFDDENRHRLPSLPSIHRQKLP